MATLVTHHGFIYSGRVHYVVLNLHPKLLAHAPLPEATWVLARDFNNIESLTDKQGYLQNLA